LTDSKQRISTTEDEQAVGRVGNCHPNLGVKEAESIAKSKVARFCILYDCLYPWTIGGAERWYHNLALALAEEGHDVTYLTLNQWEAGNEPNLPGVRVVAVGPRLPLYRDGKRRIWPPIRFGIGVFLHLLRHGRRYDRVHTASFPFFSLLAAALIRPLGRYTIAVDWFEVWSRIYWTEYLGRLGAVGWWVQKPRRCSPAFIRTMGTRA
jgi:glycosyltransferase involved in cell wall biosynthesis